MSTKHQYTETRIREFYRDLWVPPFDVVRKSTDIEIVLDPKYNRRPDKLSKDVYGTEQYWWVFALYNKDVLVDPLNDFVSGITIVYPQTVPGVV